MKYLVALTIILSLALITACSGSATVTVTQTVTPTAMPTVVITIPAKENPPPITITVTVPITPAFSPTEPTIFEPIVITGAGDLTSPPFTITTDEWTIDWSFIPESDPALALFNLFVYPRGETQIYVESILFAKEMNGMTYSYAGPGEYYIKVSAANIANWTVTIKPAS